MMRDGLEVLALFLWAILAAIAAGPWVVLVVLEWLLAPHTGSWALWAHGIGGAWCAIVAGVFLIRRIRG